GGFLFARAFSPGSGGPPAFMKGSSISEISMLKPWSHDRTMRDMNSLVSSRNALRFLYDESVGLGNADITRLLGEALRCSDRLIAEGEEICHESSDALFYLYFLRAILGLHPEKIRHLVALLQWLGIIPGDGDTARKDEAARKAGTASVSTSSRPCV
ncbi:MAG: hypothetical protein ACRELF_11530, partial [Gemmataceae bacterium]